MKAIYMALFILGGCCKDIGNDRCRVDSIFTDKYCIYDEFFRRKVCYDKHGNIEDIEVY